ncbi:MAG: methyltransferase domain-containing protein [Planctomycetales bacterium]|nr:methyltransferase domain-containing protein [Planctomycetales bacterium]
MHPTGPTLDVEAAVRKRYSQAAQRSEAALCCPVDYDSRFLKVLPAELVERDYGCGDPSQHLGAGETVLDLGSGGGKICYIAAQVVGPTGRVIGVDKNDQMLALARRYQQQIGEALGYHNTEFCKARIQDLGLDLEAFEAYLAERPVGSADDWIAAEAHAAHLRRTSPLIPDESVDVVISNCVLNLVTPGDRRQLFAELFRTLRRGGRVVISDIVSDQPVPQRLRDDPALWSGCISGAFGEEEFLRQFEAAGFYGVELVACQQDPWATVEGIEFRSVTVRAFKGKEGPCLDHREAVIYRGPWQSVTDDDGHVLRRGVRTAVCRKTFEIYTRAPYAEQIMPVPPRGEVTAGDARPFDCRPGSVRDPQETKGLDYQETQLPGEGCCEPGDACC